MIGERYCEYIDVSERCHARTDTASFIVFYLRHGFVINLYDSYWEESKIIPVGTYEYNI